ncbi:MAG: RluA family pseudouridine synthase, partial [Lachnospiraceae bacterium]|nr:RluA family pseudouridine synthase [Lachnospiraceae bacterium]
YDKFCGRAAVERAETDLEILFEDADIVLINKPAGMLSQSTGDGTPSVNEYLIGYLLGKGAVTEESLRTFRPAVCNRLDRNTSGIIAAGKSLKGLQQLSRVFHDRTVHKDYLTLVDGVLKKEKKIKGYLIKDPNTNKVQILEQAAAEALPIETRYTPLGDNGSVTLLKVRLITGRAHQIRAHLAGIGHPILGDKKYASQKSVSSAYRHQLLHACRLEFPEDMGELDTLKGKVVLAPLPEAFHKILTKEKLDSALEQVLSGNDTHTS